MILYCQLVCTPERLDNSLSEPKEHNLNLFKVIDNFRKDNQSHKIEYCEYMVFIFWRSDEDNNRIKMFEDKMPLNKCFEIADRHACFSSVICVLILIKYIIN